MKRWWLLWMVLVLPAAQAAEELHRFYGYVYDQKTNAYLYTEVHAQRIDGDRWLGGSIAYYTPQGERFAYKTLDFSNDPYVPVFRMDVPRQHYMQGITENRDAVVMERREGRDAPVERKRIDKVSPMCADSGFHSCLRDHFAALMAGQTVRFTLAVPGALDSFRFRARRVGETTFDGKKAVKILVELDSMLRLLAGPLELLYEPQRRQLLEFRGISNIHDPATGKPYLTRIAYYDRPPPEVPKLPPLSE